jgi:hypothetical protein
VDEAARLLRGALSVQAGVILFLQLAADPFAGWLRLPPDAILPYRLLLVAAGAQAVGLLGLILLYYFDLRREACLAAVGLLVGITVLTVAASACGLPPSVGTVLGCPLGAVLIWHRVFRGVAAVLQQTLLVQPFAAERRGARERNVDSAGLRPRREPQPRARMSIVRTAWRRKRLACAGLKFLPRPVPQV